MLRTLLLLVFPITLQAQGAGKCDMVLFSLKKGADSLWRPDAPRFLTAFNRGGYNNQPSFFSNHELWLTAQFRNDTTQTDLIALDLTAKTQTRVTATPATAEYSPTLMPGGKRFSAVRVEADGNQRLWSFPLDRSDNGRPEFPKIYNVGYHCWLRDTLAVFFIVGENDQPHTLYAAGTRAQKPQRIAANIGRCLVKRPDGKLLFVQKPTEQTWFLKTWDPVTNVQEILVKMPPGTEDFALLPDGVLLAGNGAKLYQYNPRREAEWREVADLGRFMVKKITRLAASKDGKLAVVVE
jgi:hypothetical protein